MSRSLIYNWNILIICCLAVGCAGPGVGLLYTNVVHSNPHPKQQVAPDVGVRTAKACTTTILGLVSWGDSSLKTAADDAGIIHISTVDIETTLILLGLYSQTCTKVAGS